MRKPAAPRRDFASRLFGYDIFISFALGPPPRGSLSYASDLARRLRERDFTVFFSEDEAPPGEELDGTLSRALHGSRALVVIANRGTLQAPRWVRKEVESFLGLVPARPIIPISVDGSLQDPALAAGTLEWLPFEGRIWLDETQAAADGGVASVDLVERLALVPRRVRSNVKWRWLVRTVGAALLALAIGMAISAKLARDSEKRAVASEQQAVESDQRARQELRRSVSLLAAAETPAMLAGDRAGGHERALQQVLAARAIGGSTVEVEGAMLSAIKALPHELKVLDTGAAIHAAAWSPASGSALFVTGGSGGRVQQWDANTLQPIGTTLAGPTADVFGVAYSPDGQRIAAAGIGGALWLWNAQTGATLAGPGGEPRDAIRSLAFMPDGRRIVTGGVGGALQFWDTSTGQPVGEPLQGFGEVIASLAISPDGRRMVSGGDFHLQLWTAKAVVKAAAVPGTADAWTSVALETDPPVWTLGVAFNRDGTRVASGANDGTVRQWDGRTGKALGGPLNGHPKGVANVRFSPDGAQLLSGGGGGTLVLWDVRRGERIGDWLNGQSGGVTALAFRPDGQRAVTGGEDGLLRLWDAGAAAPLAAPAAPAPTAGRGVGLSPDGALKAVGSDNGALRLVDVRNGQPIGAPVFGHQKPEGMNAFAKDRRVALQSVAFSRDGQHIVSGSQNGSIRLWQANPLKPLGALLLGHEHAVASVLFSPDGRHVVSGGADGTLRFWLVDASQTARAVGQPLVAHAEGVKGVAFSPDGLRIVTSGLNGAVRSWSAPAAWPSELCAKLTRNMSRRQWSDWISTEIGYREQCPGLPIPN